MKGGESVYMVSSHVTSGNFMIFSAFFLFAKENEFYGKQFIFVEVDVLGCCCRYLSDSCQCVYSQYTSMEVVIITVLGSEYIDRNLILC